MLILSIIIINVLWEVVIMRKRLLEGVNSEFLLVTCMYVSGGEECREFYKKRRRGSLLIALGDFD